MARTKSIDVFKRDSLLVDFMREHKGEENLVSSKEIKEFLDSVGYKTNINFIHSIIRKIMYERNAPICFSNINGYYWAKNRAEIEKTVRSMEDRIDAFRFHISHLKQFVVD